MTEPDDFDIPYSGYDSGTPDDIWEDANHELTPIKELDTSHIANILRGLRSGKPYWGQKHKEPALKAELESRLSNGK